MKEETKEAAKQFADKVVPPSDWLEAAKKPVTILLVEDNGEDRQMLTVATQVHHCQIIEARSGEEALQIVKEHPEIKYIFLDEKLPKMSGLETFAAIRKTLPEAMVIFLSGYAGEFVRKVCDIGFAPVVGKPMSDSTKFFHDMLDRFGVPRKMVAKPTDPGASI
jgi:CheY-like chemotaxis protein